RSAQTARQTMRVALMTPEERAEQVCRIAGNDVEVSCRIGPNLAMNIAAAIRQAEAEKVEECAAMCDERLAIANRIIEKLEAGGNADEADRLRILPKRFQRLAADLRALA